jgi:hypothetical protein
MMTLLLAALLGCTTHVGAKSTAATDQVQIVRGGPMPVEGQPIQGKIIASGDGLATTKTTYVLGRRFWAVAENDEGRSVVQIRNKAKGVGIVGCAAGTIGLGVIFGAPWACLYVSGPTSDVVTVQTPEGSK